MIVVDTGLIPKAGIAQELWRVKDFTSYQIVLQLVSADSVSKILCIQTAEHYSVIALCTSLFFRRVHLFSVNSKNVQTAKQRVLMY